MINTTDHINEKIIKEQFAAGFIQVLKQGTRIATGSENTAGDAHELMNKLRVEIEEDKRERH